MGSKNPFGTFTMDGGLSEDYVSELKEAFNMFAGNTDSITKDTLSTCMKQVGFRPSAADIDKMFEDAVDGARKISFSEFVTMMGEKQNSVDDATTLKTPLRVLTPMLLEPLAMM